MDSTDCAWTVGPVGERLTAASLPAAHPPRWFPRLKAQVVAAVEGGVIGLEEACARYEILPQEYASWRRGLELGGLGGVRTTRVQQCRTRHEGQFRSELSAAASECGRSRLDEAAEFADALLYHAKEAGRCRLMGGVLT